MRIAVPTALFIASISGPATALDFGSGLSLTGEVELENVSVGSANDTAIWADVTLAWRSEGTGAIGFGFDIGLDGFRNLGEGDQREVFWGGLVITTGIGDLTVGAARPVLEGTFDLPRLGGSQFAEVDFLSLIGPVAENFSVLEDDQPTGISLLGTTGNLTYAISYNQPEEDLLTFTQLGLSYRLGETVLKSGFERVELGGLDLDTLSLGVAHDFGRLDVGFLLSEGISGPLDLTVVRLHSGFEVTETLSVEAMLIDIRTSGNDTQIYGVSGEYGFGQGGYARLGFADTEELSGSDDIFSAAVGFRF